MASPGDAIQVDQPTPTPAGPSKPRALSVPLATPQWLVGYIYSADMLTHFSVRPEGHPEQPARIHKIWEIFVAHDLTKRMKWIPIRQVQEEEALLVHSQDHWYKVLKLREITEQQRVDSEAFYEQLSLYVSPGTTDAARLSCGGVIEASLAVARGEVKRSFAIVRPPGHHAEPDEHMGFCFFNNVAVAAKVVQQLTPIKKILILDWDVHHGNGTQRAFNDDPSVLYISLHRYEGGTFYPCGPFGSLTSCGEGAGAGFSVNISWPCAGMNDGDYLYAFQKVIMPIAMEFAPELVIISAGFDAADGDDLGECHVTPGGYAHMTHMLAGLAGGRVVVALEGGYNLDSISHSALAVCKTLLGEPPEQLPPLEASPEAVETVWAVAREHSKYWKTVDPKACEPREEFEDISFTLPEILKAHRQQYLFKAFDMMQIPLAGPAFEDRFSSQVTCTNDVFDNKTLVLFVHEFGNLRLEVDSSATLDAEMERSYLIDVSKSLINWIRSAGYSLVDVNLFPKPSETPLGRNKTMEDVGRDLLVYIWDNYIQLSSAQKIVLIGHGPGCKPLIELVTRRIASMIPTVKAVIQIVGFQRQPSSPQSNEEVRTWYQSNSLLILPELHPLLSPSAKPKFLKRHGVVIPIKEERQVKLILTAMPAIKDYVQEALTDPLNNKTNKV